MPEHCISQCAVFVQAGDFVDRGSWSAEIILTLFAYKAMFPQHVHLARGNHESRGMNKVYGFDGEVSSSPLLTFICHAHLLVLGQQQQHNRGLLPHASVASYSMFFTAPQSDVQASSRQNSNPLFVFEALDVASLTDWWIPANQSRAFLTGRTRHITLTP